MGFSLKKGFLKFEILNPYQECFKFLTLPVLLAVTTAVDSFAEYVYKNILLSKNDFHSVDLFLTQTIFFFKTLRVKTMLLKTSNSFIFSHNAFIFIMKLLQIAKLNLFVNYTNLKWLPVTRNISDLC